jgi:hypothetical protein
MGALIFRTAAMICAPYFGPLAYGVTNTVLELELREITRDWRELRNNEVHNFPCLSNTVE